MNRLIAGRAPGSAALPAAIYQEVWRAYTAVGIVGVLFFGLIGLSYAAGETVSGIVGRGLIYLLIQALYVFAFPLMLLTLAVDPHVVLQGQSWLAIPQVLASAGWLGAFTWIAARQPTPRRRAGVAVILGLWVMAVLLLQAIQLWTPVATDELFGAL